MLVSIDRLYYMRPLAQHATPVPVDNSISFVLPFLPPSVNTLYRVDRTRGSIYKDRGVKKFIADAGWFLHAEREMDTPCRLDLLFTFGETSIKKSDLDNREKILIDCLQTYGLLKNDNLIYEKFCRKVPGDTDGVSGTLSIISL